MRKCVCARVILKSTTRLIVIKFKKRCPKKYRHSNDLRRDFLGNLRMQFLHGPLLLGAHGLAWPSAVGRVPHLGLRCPAEPHILGARLLVCLLIEPLYVN